MQVLKTAASEIGIELTAAQLDMFGTYEKLLLEWNEKMNLTGITEHQEILLKHFFDSISLLPYISKNASLIDIGTGAGFPGVPLKIAASGLNVTLVDSLNKRLIFLENVIKELKLENITCVHGRAEDLAQEKSKKYRESYEVCAARAVAPLNILCELCLPLVKVGGIFAAMKGRLDTNGKLEAEDVPASAIKKLGGELEEIIPVKIPFTDITHSIIIIRKKRQTTHEFPRKQFKIAKSPII